MTGRAVVLATWLVALAAAGAAGAEAPPEPSGYRLQDYRAPTPATLAGARVVTTAEAEELRQAGAVFVDVYPQLRRPANLPPGTLWRGQTHRSIAGSIWLPDTGYGTLTAPTENYLRSNLDRATGGDHGKWLVIYCRQDCWMSWNAAKRALAMGYRNVAWYPNGTDGWEAGGLPLQEAKPAPAEGE